MHKATRSSPNTTIMVAVVVVVVVVAVVAAVVVAAVVAAVVVAGGPQGTTLDNHLEHLLTGQALQTAPAHRVEALATMALLRLQHAIPPLLQQLAWRAKAPVAQGWVSHQTDNSRRWAPAPSVEAC